MAATQELKQLVNVLHDWLGEG